MNEVLLRCIDIKKYFPVTKGVLFRRSQGVVKAVDGVTFSIKKGEIFGLVGESGSGKTTLARVLTGVIKPTAGEIIFNTMKINKLKSNELRKLRREIGFVYQDPYSSLDPRKTVFDIVAEPMRIHGYEGPIIERVATLLSIVGLKYDAAQKYPHQFSGGQRQRIAIARALALSPKFVIADEPTSSLDVSVQAKIINLFMDLRDNLNLTILFISHDLGVIRQISDTVAVMYLGKIVEIGPTDEVLSRPLHPYTRVLLESVPIPDPIAMRQKKLILAGKTPPSNALGEGCVYRTRCPFQTEKCLTEPDLFQVNSEHFVACHHWTKLSEF